MHSSEESGPPHPRSNTPIGYALAVALAVSIALAAYPRHAARAWHAARARAGDGAVSVLHETVVAAQDGAAAEIPTLRDTDGAPFGVERLRGRWSLIAVGFTSCSDVCSTTLQVLSGVARDSASGVAAGTTQIVFVSIDPERDTREGMRRYLRHFDPRIIGLIGSEDSVARFAAAIGAEYRRTGSGFDHSTSVLVIDPAGRPAGILPRPADDDRIVADLEALRAAHASRDWRGRPAGIVN